MTNRKRRRSAGASTTTPPLGLEPFVAWLQRAAQFFKSGPEAQDAVQTALERALRSGATIRHPRAYLAQTLRNLAVDEARRVRASGGAALALEEVEDRLPSVAPDQETTLLLKQVILGLPPLYRDVFILNRFVGLTYEQIAARQGVTPKAIEYRMSRALALCQDALRD
ncbi:MAG: RNA polymerase sigma factor [Phenylobacterium sp.]|uniref:RNA polymerase sigma factor n=1 Tax=Phenylobacterium sp. TaxID=1871053 RepID=UPI0039198320